MVRFKPASRNEGLFLSKEKHSVSEAERVRQLIALAGGLETDSVDVSATDAGQSGRHGREQRSDQFSIYIHWLSDSPMLPERSYQAVSSGDSFDVRITDLAYRINPDDYSHRAAKTLANGEMAYCKISTNRDVIFSETDPGTIFVFKDSASGRSIGIAVVHFSLRRATNIVWQATKVDKNARSTRNNQTPCVIWLTGLSASGKSTIADHLEQKLHASGKHTYLLDGDNVRHGLCRDLGFTDGDRVENIRRVAEVARLMTDAGLIVITSFISPFVAERQMARDLIGPAHFIEVFVDTPLALCESRDPKGLYKKARDGALKNFTGIDSDYEAPVAPQITLSTVDCQAEALSDTIIDYLEQHHFIDPRS